MKTGGAMPPGTDRDPALLLLRQGLAIFEAQAAADLKDTGTPRWVATAQLEIGSTGRKRAIRRARCGAIRR